MHDAYRDGVPNIPMYIHVYIHTYIRDMRGARFARHVDYNCLALLHNVIPSAFYFVHFSMNELEISM